MCAVELVQAVGVIDVRRDCVEVVSSKSISQLRLAAPEVWLQRNINNLCLFQVRFWINYFIDGFVDEIYRIFHFKFNHRSINMSFCLN